MTYLILGLIIAITVGIALWFRHKLESHRSKDNQFTGYELVKALELKKKKDEEK